MKEIWKDIEGYDGIYEISNFGNIKTRRRQGSKGGLLSPYKRPDGYYEVNLRKDNNSKLFLLHRLVAETFIPNPKKYKYINHIDGNKKNNKISNLEWCTFQHNMIEAYRIGLNPKRYGKKNPNHHSIVQLDMNNNFIKEWDYIRIASLTLKIPEASISDCCRKKHKSTHNFKFIYKEDYII